MQRIVKAEERMGHQRLEATVIGQDGSNLGQMGYRQAKSLAESEGVDLVEVSSRPLAWRLMDYGKAMYKASKALKASKVSSRRPKEHEVKFGLTVAQADYERFVSHARGFLVEGDAVKVTVFLRKFEMRHPEKAQDMLDRVLADLGPCRVQGSREMAGRSVSVRLTRISGASAQRTALMNRDTGETETVTNHKETGR